MRTIQRYLRMNIVDVVKTSAYVIYFIKGIYMTHDIQKKQDVLDLADASNELCVAIETLKIAYPEMNGLASKNLYKHKDEVWRLLAKFGY